MDRYRPTVNSPNFQYRPQILSFINPLSSYGDEICGQTGGLMDLQTRQFLEKNAQKLLFDRSDRV